ncbi:MAG: deoxyribonuclease [Gammaproteobacteria bacterium RIFCSPHIGHO2_12_FULL_41_20]|nr:MAG: deoxyribonuclease [Gammaproteobacteria bacterium RIFCSPHIGHO2_12_FULL_41_20]
MFLVDSHCHLDQLDLAPYQGQLDRALAHAREAGVEYILNVCINLADFPKVLQIAKDYSSSVSATVGLHPNEAEEVDLTQKLLHYAQDEKIVAIGETGLDYYRSAGDLAWQRQRFREHIQVAKEVNKPLIVHSRQAKADTLHILREEKASDVQGVLHCFTEDWEMARQAMDMGFYISFSGVVTFRNAKTVQDVAARIPLDKLLLETDAPYLAPDPYRGKANVPAYMRHTAEYIAQLKGMDVAVLAQQTTKNFFTLFHGVQQPHV